MGLDSILALGFLALCVAIVMPVVIWQVRGIIRDIIRDINGNRRIVMRDKPTIDKTTTYRCCDCGERLGWDNKSHSRKDCIKNLQSKIKALDDRLQAVIDSVGPKPVTEMSFRDMGTVRVLVSRGVGQQQKKGVIKKGGQYTDSNGTRWNVGDIYDERNWSGLWEITRELEPVTTKKK
jgi:hypothetical protein